MGLWRRKITTSDDTATNAAHLTLRASMVSNLLVTILFFLWAFSYGLLDVLNSHLQKEMGITAWPRSRPPPTPSSPSAARRVRCSEIRLNLNLAQAVQGVGSFVAPLLASRVFLANTVGTDDGLQKVQWAYLGVGGFDALLIALFFLAPMPEITDADMHLQETEVAVANYFINFCKDAGRDTAASSARCRLGPVRLQPLRHRPAADDPGLQAPVLAAIELLMLVMCLESLCFATIYTKLGGTLLVSAISGGMVFPPMTGAVVDARDAHTAMAIPMMGYILALISSYPIYVDVWKRDVMDAHRDTDVGLEPAAPYDADKALQLEA
ncbi:hypothetical protein B0T26DRAFT_677413 [Lasiosphaeria miniovina]|uniref:Uncharacterized protein n=1 Tax=Lasiosphaeria miniovina TaxID=1954250 RepID=A0AA40ABV0_9PEZI|nr:uncharacterized protein B0T26DRAFT_677413 [Lasiosphaeria miniovina]KAK0713022.1 hypothetical protein B0T26DRAFT_677413 [Lasiosphaeria miniovina]